MAMGGSEGGFREANRKRMTWLSDNVSVCLPTKSFADSYLAMISQIISRHLRPIQKVSVDSKGF
jgi:hypothetical protein